MSDTATGIAEVRFVAEHTDAMDPPTPWCYWDKIPGELDYQQELARPYARATASTIAPDGMKYDADTKAFSLSYDHDGSGRETDVFLGALNYPNGWEVTVTEGEAKVVTNEKGDGLVITASGVAGPVSVAVAQPQAAKSVSRA